jgi:hypothetical protein
MHSCNKSCTVQFWWNNCRQLSLPTKYARWFHHCFKLLVPCKCTDVIYTPRQKKLFLYILAMKFQTVKLENTQTLQLILLLPVPLCFFSLILLNFIISKLIITCTIKEYLPSTIFIQYIIMMYQFQQSFTIKSDKMITTNSRVVIMKHETSSQDTYFLHQIQTR